MSRRPKGLDRIHRRVRSSVALSLAALIVRPHAAIVAHLGDSRVYRLRAGQLDQLTRDHSLYEQLLETGADLPPLDQFAYANVVTRALGAAEDDRPELHTLDLQDDDRYLLCSDGLSGVLGPDEIAAQLAHTPIEQVADVLVDAAFTAFISAFFATGSGCSTNSIPIVFSQAIFASACSAVAHPSFASTRIGFCVTERIAVTFVSSPGRPTFTFRSG